MSMTHPIKKHQFLLLFTIILMCFSAFPALARVLTSPLSRSVCEKLTPSFETELEQFNAQLGDPIFIRIFKESNELELWIKGEKKYTLFKTYEICSYSGELGPKQREGDKQSPEGFYFVQSNHLNPFSSFHLSFNIGYPNNYDRAYGRTGSALMVHGNCVSIGCFAMTDPKVEEIYTLAEAALKKGQPFFRIHIFPFRMTDENMARHKYSKWVKFWKNLKEGYDHFETNRVPPETTVKHKKYVFDTDDRYTEVIPNQEKHFQLSTR